MINKLINYNVIKIISYYTILMSDSEQEDIIQVPGEGETTELATSTEGEDIDERYSKSITERQHTDEHILDIIGLYIDKLKELIKEEQLADFNIPVFVMQKDKINVTDDCVKDGIHLIFGLIFSYAVRLHSLAQYLRLPMVFPGLPIFSSQSLWQSFDIQSNFVLLAECSNQQG